MKNANSIFRLDAMARRGQAGTHTKPLPRPSTPASTPAQPPPSPIPCFLTPSTFSLLSSPMHLFLTFFFLFSPFPSCFHVSPSLIFFRFLSVPLSFLFPLSFLCVPVSPSFIFILPSFLFSFHISFLLYFSSSFLSFSHLHSVSIHPLPPSLLLFPPYKPLSLSLFNSLSPFPPFLITSFLSFSSPCTPALPPFPFFSSQVK